MIVACCFLVACQSRTVVRAPNPTPTAAPQAVATPPPATVPANPTVPSASAPPTSTGPVGSSPVAAASPVASAPSPVACHYGPSRRIAEVQDRAIKEASALVASQRWPGVYWTVNDSGNAPNVFAVDEQGRAHGTFRVEGAENDDWESMQSGPGRDGGTALYVGDIGDNDGKRRELTIYRVPEPEPSAAGSRAANGRTASAEAFKISYPSGARDAETLLVHPKTGEMLIVTKETAGRAVVFQVPLPLDTRRTARMEQIASLDLRAIGAGADLVTDGTVSPDGRRVTIRTYGRALEYDVPEGAPLASIWGQTPRVSAMNDGVQGESITYRADGIGLVSISEGSPAPLFLTPWTC
jgi:hypothetical protein